MPSPLISCEALSALIEAGTKNLIIVDSRHELSDPTAGRRAYDAGHIPGAIFISVEEELSAAKTGQNGRHPLPAPEVFAATLGAKGVGNTAQVVVYDSGNAMITGRLWWMLRWLGHDNVQVLDGGIAQWQKEGRSLETENRTRPATTFNATLRPEMRLTVSETQATLGQPQRMIIDARGAERYRGDVEPIDPVGGHIPGAFNRPFPSNLVDGRFKDAATLRAEFETLLGDRKPEDVIHQCGSGISACANLIAMEVAGLTGSKLYAGSWSEWCADSSRPVAKA